MRTAASRCGSTTEPGFEKKDHRALRKSPARRHPPSDSCTAKGDALTPQPLMVATAALPFAPRGGRHPPRNPGCSRQASLAPKARPGKRNLTSGKAHGKAIDR